VEIEHKEGKATKERRKERLGPTGKGGEARTF